jgi:hypothetical protein
MDALHFMEALRIEQLPGSKDVYLMRPDGSDIIEAEREIEEKKGVWIHDPNIDRWPIERYEKLPKIKLTYYRSARVLDKSGSLVKNSCRRM